MHRFFARLSQVALVAALFVTVATPALADGRTAPQAPRSQVYQDDDRSLTVVELPAFDGRGTAVTLVFRDETGAQSITIDPTEATGRDAAILAAFLGRVDDDFVRYIRATLADRMLHAETPASAFDRAQLGIFFPGHAFRTEGVLASRKAE